MPSGILAHSLIEEKTIRNMCQARRAESHKDTMAKNRRRPSTWLGINLPVLQVTPITLATGRQLGQSI